MKFVALCRFSLGSGLSLRSCVTTAWPPSPATSSAAASLSSGSYSVTNRGAGLLSIAAVSGFVHEVWAEGGQLASLVIKVPFALSALSQSLML